MYQTSNEIDHIGTHVVSRRLPKSQWTHSAHFALALWLIDQRGYRQAQQDIPKIIQDYNLSVGTENSDTDGYHHTITLASLAAAQDIYARHSKGKALHEIAHILVSSVYGQPNWPLNYWKEARLFSIEARHNWLAPDLRPLPFQV